MAARTSPDLIELISGTSSPGSKLSTRFQQQACQMARLARKLAYGRGAAGFVDRPVPSQRREARLHIGSEQVAQLAVDLVHPLHGVEEASAFLIELGSAVETVADPLLAIGAGHDPLEIESGKRLPFAFEQGKHLPQAVAQRRGAAAHLTLVSRPAAIIASATRIGISG